MRATAKAAVGESEKLGVGEESEPRRGERGEAAPSMPASGEKPERLQGRARKKRRREGEATGRTGAGGHCRARVPFFRASRAIGLANVLEIYRGLEAQHEIG